MTGRSASRPEGDGGRQYHVGLAPGEVARSIVLVGDPKRAERVAARFDSVRPGFPKSCREYVSITGARSGRDVTVVATGMGCDNTEIAVVELLNCVERPDFIRVGSCGALRGDIALGDLVISTGSVRLESTSLGFVEEGWPAIAHHEALLALISAASRLKAPHHVGLTATAAGFYGWQGRKGQAIPPRFPDLPERLGRAGVLNLEMESSTLFILAGLAGLRAGCVCTAFANRPKDLFIDGAAKEIAEDRAVDVGLAAFDVLAEMDARRGAAPRFTV